MLPSGHILRRTTLSDIEFAFRDTTISRIPEIFIETEGVFCYFMLRMRLGRPAGQKAGYFLNFCFWRDKRGNGITLEKIAT